MCSRLILTHFFLFAAFVLIYAKDVFVITPKIEVFKRGLQISAPNYGFSDFTVFITSPKSDVSAASTFLSNETWIYQNSDVTLEVGDTLKFWIFYSRHSLGYSKVFDPFIVREVINKDAPWIYTNTTPEFVPEEIKPSTTSQPPSTTTTRPFNSTYPPVEDCAYKISKMTTILLEQAKDVTKLLRQNALMQELLESHESLSKKLIIHVKIPTGKNAPSYIQNLLKDRLNAEVNVNILAQYNSAVIFEVRTLREKLIIIDKVKNQNVKQNTKSNYLRIDYK